MTAVAHVTLSRSVPSSYRIPRERGEVRERRRQATHPPRVKPELVAEAPNTMWSWNVTKPRGPDRRVFFCLYTMIYIYSRYTVGWMVAHREHESLARQFVTGTVGRHAVGGARSTIHSDRGAIHNAKSVAELMADLGHRRRGTHPPDNARSNPTVRAVSVNNTPPARETIPDPPDSTRTRGYEPLSFLTREVLLSVQPTGPREVPSLQVRTMPVI
ncbi:DDE-type integrase/transposase/recombinase [Embleya sp. NPDC127516]|uniref:DDE-type integrase/transposase/recombinase n=1 Tax=Embleya sp. NPDC127516 TaxID=3363990 RepID=UPI0038113D6D